MKASGTNEVLECFPESLSVELLKEQRGRFCSLDVVVSIAEG